MRIGKLLLILLLLSVSSFSQTTTIPAPTNLKAALEFTTSTTNLRGVILTWDYGTITLLVNFNIYRKPGPIASTTPVVKIGTTNQRSYLDSQIVSGMTYSYFVTAVINNVESPHSNIVQITIPPSPPPVISYGKITGHLYDDTTKSPIFNGIIYFLPGKITPGTIIPISSVSALLAAKTDQYGNFSARLKAGMYYLYSTARGYKSEFYDNVKTIQQAAKITLNANDSLYFNIGLTKLSAVLVAGSVDIEPSNSSSLNAKVGLSPTVENYPNPFNPSTVIKYQLPQSVKVSLIVYDILGREVSTLVNDFKSAGTYQVTFNASNLPSGIYFYKLETGQSSQINKMMLVK